MSAITFPCRTGRQPFPPAPGRPGRAASCQCVPGGLLDKHAGTCVRCGRYPATVIDQTWRARARQLTKAAR